MVWSNAQATKSLGDGVVCEETLDQSESTKSDMSSVVTCLSATLVGNEWANPELMDQEDGCEENDATSVEYDVSMFVIT